MKVFTYNNRRPLLKLLGYWLNTNGLTIDSFDYFRFASFAYVMGYTFEDDYEEMISDAIEFHFNHVED